MTIRALPTTPPTPMPWAWYQPVPDAIPDDSEQLDDFRDAAVRLWRRQVADAGLIVVGNPVAALLSRAVPRPLGEYRREYRIVGDVIPRSAGFP